MQETAAENLQSDHFDELSELFNSFRLAELNRRYYARRLETLKALDAASSLVILVSTGAAFGVLSIPGFPHAPVVGAILAAVGFLASIAVPVFGLAHKIEQASERACAFHYAVQLLECALRFVKRCAYQKGEVAGWVASAQQAYRQAAALQVTEVPNPVLVKKVEDEINEQFPPSYVWTSL